MHVSQRMAVEGTIEVAQDFCLLCCKGVLADQAEAGKADVHEVEEGGVVGWRGGGDDVSCGGYGGEAVVAGQKERVYGCCNGGDVGSMLEGGWGGGGEHVVGRGVLEEGDVEGEVLLYAMTTGFWWRGDYGRARWREDARRGAGVGASRRVLGKRVVDYVISVERALGHAAGQGDAPAG